MPGNDEVSHFHIAFKGPPNYIFNSLSSSELDAKKPLDKTLQHVRTKAKISSKLSFLTEDACGISDSTTLGYYIGLTAQVTDTKNTSTGTPVQGSNQDQDQSPRPKIRTILLTVGKPGEKPLYDIPKLGRDLNQLLDRIDDNGLARGQLPSIGAEYRKLAGDVNHAVNEMENAKYDTTEPNELTGQHWDVILRNNRVLHGYYYNTDLEMLVKAPKPAFQITESTTKTPAKTQAKTPVTKDASESISEPLTPIPPFFIYDDAKVTVTEIQRAFQETMVDEGFSSRAVEADVGGKKFGTAISVSAAFSDEFSNIKQKEDTRSVDSLHVAYNFPRVIVELDPDCLIVTEECKQMAKDTSGDEKAVQRFYETYGNAFVTRFSLGGYLKSTRHLTQIERKSLAQAKEKTRQAAGLSFQSPKAGGNLNYASITEKGNEEGQASLSQSLQLAWEARGGNTLLCSNPAAWATTVKDHRLWRVMDQHRVINMESLIRGVDIFVYNALQGTLPPSGNIEDKAYRRIIESVILDAIEAVEDDEKQAVVTKIQNYYHNEKFSLEDYNEFVLNKIKTPIRTIYGKATWVMLTPDQKLGIGLWSFQNGIIQMP